MKMTFRWYGEKDSIPLQYISEIPNMYSVVTAIYDIPVGEVWPMEKLLEMKAYCDKNNLKMEVIESVPVHEDIKLGRPTRDKYINAYIQNILNLGKVGVKCICYNFMPVFDWLRTDMRHINKDGSNSLAYNHEQLMKLDVRDLHLPGWDESYTPSEMFDLINAYKDVDKDKLFNNLVYFLNRIMPVCDEADVNMAIHPDDPPWDMFGLPRVITSMGSFDKMFEAVPNKHNGVTFCTGSLGAGRFNNLVDMAGKLAKDNRIFFAHIRQLKYENDKDFVEAGHLTKAGDLDIYGVVKALVDNGFDGYVRPDHGRNVWGENGKPGYGLYDRAMGACYLNGLFEAIEKQKENK